jgi:hypothetical protein
MHILVQQSALYALGCYCSLQIHSTGSAIRRLADLPCITVISNPCLLPPNFLLSPSPLPLLLYLSPFSLHTNHAERNLKLFVAPAPAHAFPQLHRLLTQTLSADSLISLICQLGEDSNLLVPTGKYLSFTQTASLSHHSVLYHLCSTNYNLFITVSSCLYANINIIVVTFHHGYLIISGLPPFLRHVGIFGNADPLDIAQWFSVATSVPTPTRRFDPRTGVCSNMFTGRSLHLFTSDSAKKSSILISFILFCSVNLNSTILATLHLT